VRFAYADPPYPGNAHYYEEHPDYGGEVNHAHLIQYLIEEFPDGWALSTQSPALRDLIALCPLDSRIAAWVKPFASFKPNVNPAYAWEPVIFNGGRNRGKKALTVVDWVSVPITLKKGLTGAKPPAFCRWIFDLLGAEPSDELVDLFPGTGAVSTAWKTFQTSNRMQFGGKQVFV
jgi:hypothetical protein